MSAAASMRTQKPNLRKATLILRPAIVVSAIGIAVSALLIGIRQLGVIEPLELRAYDQLMRLRPDEKLDERLLVVQVTEADLKRYGFPLPDRVLAQALQELDAHRPRVIGLDIYRDMPVNPGHEEFIQHLQQNNRVTVICKSSSDKNFEVTPPDILLDDPIQKVRVGFSDVVFDPDGVVRRSLLFLVSPENPELKCRTSRSLGVQLAFKYLAGEGIEPGYAPNRSLQLGSVVFDPINKNAGGYTQADSKGYQVLLNYRSRQQPAREVTLTQVMEGSVDSEWIRNNIILIGATAGSTKDSFFTPYSPGLPKDAEMPGVKIHAQITSQIISAVLDGRPLIWFWSDWEEMVWVLAWSLMGGVLAWRIRHPLGLGLTLAGTLSVMFIGSAWAFTRWALWVPLVPPALGVVAVGSGVVAYKILYNTFHDQLTGLPNRTSFLRQLEQQVQRARKQELLPFTVFFVGLDRFKVINDGLGHAVGDRLLVAIAQRLQTYLPPTGILARVGGDEFAILLPGIENTNKIADIANQLQKQLALPFQLNDREVFTTISIGIVQSKSTDDRAADLLRDAHTAMYRAKALGGSCYRVFDTGMHAQAVTRLQLETELRQALTKAQTAAEDPVFTSEGSQEFQLYYQPLISLSTGKIVGFEALIRWLHPNRGLTSPTLFIPVAEETGLIVPLGQWVLQEACQQAKAWQEKFQTDPPLNVSVNLSGKQFSQPDLVEQIACVLQETGLNARSLKLELTESIVMEDVESAITMLAQMKALNVQLSIDDFGTGYSSLSYLYRFPTDTLKIDRSFVSRIEDDGENAAIVRTIVTLAHNLGMDVIAEGIETMEQFEQLQALGCEYGQGYFFSHPLDSEAAAALLIASPQW